MSAASRRKGPEWEANITRVLKASGWPHVERRVGNGIHDRGDINLGNGAPVVIEAKNEKRINLAGYLREAHVERDNAHAEVGVAWIKRRGKGSALDGYVVMDGRTFVKLLKDAGY